MTISDNAETFAGKRVVDYTPNSPVVHDPETVYRIHWDYDAGNVSAHHMLTRFLAAADLSRLDALVLGNWTDSYEQSPESLLNLLIVHAPQLTQLKALFVGDITYQECEISWITQGDYTALLAAFPQLEKLRIRGSRDLQLPATTHAGLRELTIECGGLPRSVLQSLAASQFPALTHLELWLGTDNYGWDADITDVEAVVTALRTPHLRHLGLRDAEIADEVAQWLRTQEAWLPQLHTLDLSLGVLTDTGAEHLLHIPALAGLQRLDLSHHYLRPEWQERLRTSIPNVVLDDPQDPDDDYPYVAVGE